jgi:hypothetical protein
MKTIAALVSIAFAVLAMTPALGRARHQHNQAVTNGQVYQGYHPSQVRNGDIPFAPF